MAQDNERASAVLSQVHAVGDLAHAWIGLPMQLICSYAIDV
jgi:hypothetical protein